MRGEVVESAWPRGADSTGDQVPLVVPSATTRGAVASFKFLTSHPPGCGLVSASLQRGSDGMSNPKTTGRVFAHSDPRMHKVLAHRVRYQIVMRLGEAPGTSAKLAERLGESPKYISRLIEELVAEGVVEQVGKEPGPNGGHVYTYRATDRYLWDAEEWAALPEVERKNASFAISQTLTEEIGRALQSGSFDSHQRRVLIRRPLWGDDQCLEEIDEIQSRADREIHEAERRSAERDHSNRRPHRVTTALLSFPVSPEDRQQFE